MHHEGPIEAVRVHVGHTFPPRYPFEMGRQTVESRTWTTTPPIRLHFVIGGQFYDVDPLHRFEFPIPDREPIDWRTKPEPPRARDLRKHDLLPSPDGALEPPFGETEDDGSGERLYEPQMVLDFQMRELYGATLVYVKLSRGWHPHYTKRVYLADEPVVFPRVAPTAGEQLIAASKTQERKPTGKLEWLGPYLYDHEDGNTYEWFFSFHPHGRGRWPANIRKFDPARTPRHEGERLYARFPKSHRAWNDARLRPHPNHPDLPKGATVRGPNRASSNVINWH